jgi:hypothetical protein
MFKTLVAAATFATVMAAAGQAGAVLIDPTAYAAAGCLGAVSCVVGGATITAGPLRALLDEQDFRGQKGLGVDFVHTGQPRDPEIQGDLTVVGQEQVSIKFGKNSQIVTDIQLAHFYNPDEFSGDPQEIAIISANGGALSGTLQVLDNAGNFIVTGDLNGLGVSLVNSFTGVWQLLDPFGDNAITSLSFTAANTPKSGDNSDYTIALVQTSDVPEPTTLGLLGIGLLGLGMAGMRRRRRAGN